MPEIIWKHGGDIHESINLLKLKFEKPFEKFGYDSQKDAEAGILAAFRSVIRNSSEHEKKEKMENLLQLCLQIEKMAKHIYKEEMKGKKEGEFCGKIREEPSQHEHGMPSHHQEDEDIE